MDQVQKMHFVSATAIIVKDGKFLIARRSANEKAFPNQWTVPGGKLSRSDYESRSKDTEALWYNVVEDLVRREVSEEVDLQIENLRYLTSITFIRPDGFPTLIISMLADYKSGVVKLCDALTDFAWVTVSEAKQYELIDGILDELVMAQDLLAGKKQDHWQRH